MSNVLKLSEFTKRPDSRVAFATWLCSRRIDSELGAFALELQTEESLAPDQRMLELANELLEFVRANAAMVGDLVFASYQRKANQDPEWFHSLAVSTQLSRKAVLEHLDEKRWLRISRDSACDPPYTALIHLIPRWDREHAFRLTIREGRPVELNDSEAALRQLREPAI